MTERTKDDEIIVSLLTALKLMVGINGGLGHSAAVKKAMEAIAKAEGR